MAKSSWEKLLTESNHEAPVKAKESVFQGWELFRKIFSRSPELFTEGMKPTWECMADFKSKGLNYYDYFEDRIINVVKYLIVSSLIFIPFVVMVVAMIIRK